MPSSIEILAGLQNISNEWRVAAIGWHVALGALLASLNMSHSCGHATLDEWLGRRSYRVEGMQERLARR